MADYCKQCSIAIFGRDFGDLKWIPMSEEEKTMIRYDLCEGCGPIAVNPEGECVSPDCMEKGHGKREDSSGSEHEEVPPAG